MILRFFKMLYKAVMGFLIVCIYFPLAIMIALIKMGFYYVKDGKDGDDILENAIDDNLIDKLMLIKKQN